jgi:hypothetical protein
MSDQRVFAKQSLQNCLHTKWKNQLEELLVLSWKAIDLNRAQRMTKAEQSLVRQHTREQYAIPIYWASSGAIAEAILRFIPHSAA